LEAVAEEEVAVVEAEEEAPSAEEEGREALLAGICNLWCNPADTSANN
jgi:hypothetical protein